MFFVLSGYLITRGLITDASSGIGAAGRFWSASCSPAGAPVQPGHVTIEDEH